MDCDRAHVRGHGVLFPSWHANRRHACYVMGMALEQLAGRPLGEHQLLDVFRAHRRRIHAAAHLLLAQGAQGDPVLLPNQAFGTDRQAQRQRARRGAHPPATELCRACHALQGRLGDVLPHDQLRIVGTARIRATAGRPGTSRAVFQCRDCRHWISRPHASAPLETWRLEPPGT